MDLRREIVEWDGEIEALSRTQFACILMFLLHAHVNHFFRVFFHFFTVLPHQVKVCFWTDLCLVTASLLMLVSKTATSPKKVRSGPSSSALII